MMESDELVLSDVHLDENLSRTQVINSANTTEQYFVSRIIFKCMNKTYLAEDNSIRTDKDGDLDLPRCDHINDVILIKHSLSTKLNNVGLQIWPASLLLCDFILDNPDMFKSKIVIELGAGVGLCSIVVGMFSKKIISTDYLESALELCRTNFGLNTGLMVGVNNNYAVLKLDWNERLKNLDENQWSEEEVYYLHHTDLIVASDVIFSISITDAFFETIVNMINLNKKDHIQVFISLERRLNFTVEDRDITCPAYDHFIEWIQELCTLNYKYSDSYLFTCKQMSNINQHFIYTRSKYLELWMLTAEKVSKKNYEEIQP